jgi:hypothetical protein
MVRAKKWSAGCTGVVTAGLLCLSHVSSMAADPKVGRVIGRIDSGGVRFEGEAYYVFGWACQEGIDASIDVHIYADRSTYDTNKGTFVLAGHANLESEPAVDHVCHTHDGKHRFQIELPNDVLKAFQGRKLYVYGIREQDGVENAAISGSGELGFPKPPFFRIAPSAFPHLAGSYRSSPEHPRVFTTRADLNDSVKRINAPGSFSAQSFARLGNKLKGDLVAKVDWDAIYSGCDIDIYLQGFSYEYRPGYANEVRGEDELRAAMNVRADISAPKGAAVVAARLALYAALVRAGSGSAAGCANRRSSDGAGKANFVGLG